MATVTTSGGSGGPTTHTVTAASVEQKTIFTTPNTADMQFTVDVTLYGGEGFVIYAEGGIPSAGYPSVVKEDKINGPMVSFRKMYGPNVAVIVSMRNLHGTVNKDVISTYSYLGQKIT